MTLLACDGVRLTAPDGRVLLDKLDLAVSLGDRLAVMGPSGSGKTTLLRAILDTLPPGFEYAGEIRLDGAVHRPGARDTRARIIRTIATLPQDAGGSLTPTMRVGALVREAAPGRDRQRVTEVLAMVGLPSSREFLRRRPWQLSGGQQRRLALTRALVRDRPLLVLDEPTAGLDPESRRQVLQVLGDLSRELSSALLLVTHDRAAAQTLGCDIHDLAPVVAATTARQRRTPARSAQSVLALRDATLVSAAGDTIAERVNLDLRACEITALRGPSGEGKTNLARTIAGLLPLRAGTLELHGAPLPSGLRDRTVAQRRALQLVRQSADDAFNPRRSIRQSLHDTRPNIDPATLLAALDLSPDLLERRPHQLSGGQRQRLALVRALSVAPEVLVLDEPTSALDHAAAQRVIAAVRAAAERGAAVLLITHDDSLEADNFDRTLLLQGGQLREALS
ncbi:ABC transporter ATP-binding protein [Parenemella sanctibonifatiensis]|uniref:ABC transporter domain-containing protein n=1 Tax=Parenemella sanctibonifatiensis TaxID=2016505 RepID=A0A255EL97_9ACTN|nr:ATP-binding cassette domain-containing protein [Parenemella sanctibonifatiensis]OYN90232.1 hypothetical protein CGZ91_08675 [Parenemella sanctibonifatiensis]